MGIRELEQSLLKKLGPLISQYGFNTKPSGQTFPKKTDFGKVAFGVNFIRHKEDVDVTGSITIRFEDLETLVNSFRPYLSEADKRQSSSLGAELGNLSKGEPLRWTIATESDVDDVAASMANAFGEIGLPAVEKYSDMNRALQLLSREDRESLLYQPFYDTRIMRALGLAFLLKERDVFEQIVRDRFPSIKKQLSDADAKIVISFRDALAAKFAEATSPES